MLLLLLVLGLPLGPVLGPLAATPAAAVGGTTAPPCASVLCDLQRAQKGATVAEVLTGPLTVADLGDLEALSTALVDHALKVSVNPGVHTGPGGSILLDLAHPDQRFVDPTSVITRLDLPAHDRVAPACDALCKELSNQDDSGQALIKAGLAKPEPPPPAGTDWLPYLVGGVLALLLVVLGLAVRRSGGVRTRHRAEPAPQNRSTGLADTGGHGGTASTADFADAADFAEEPTVPLRSQVPVPAPRAVQRPAETLPATVGTDLHPQGYVDIDHCLYRAVWSDPAQPPPGPGESVDVARPDPDDRAQDPDVLLAFPSDPQRRAHAH